MLTNLAEVFEKYQDEYLEFDSIEQPQHPRPDLCGLFLLHSLVAPLDSGLGRKMIRGAEHDEIWFDVEPEELALKATEEDIRVLVRCGIRLDQDTNSLAMFV